MSSIGPQTFNFVKKGNGVPILSKADLDFYAESLIEDFNPELLKQPQPVPVEDFIEFYLGLAIEYQTLSTDGSILGMIAFSDGVVEVYDDQNQKKMIEVGAGTVFVDNSLLDDSQLTRCRFTLGHEPGHWLLHRHLYLVDKNQVNLFEVLDNTTHMEQIVHVKCHANNIGKISRFNGGSWDDNDWMEWQADYFSSALLMPKKSFVTAVEEILGKYEYTYDVLKELNSPGFHAPARVVATNLSLLFDVSYQAAVIRLHKLGYLSQDMLSILI